MKTFRNIAIVVVAYYVYRSVGDVLAYVAQFAVGSAGGTSTPGSVVVLHITAVLPYLIVAAPAGAIVANASKPRADLRWGFLFATWLFAEHFLFEAEWLKRGGGGEQVAGLALAGALLFAAAVSGVLFVRQRAARAA